nr:unnamed protein product [Digitaria exilis]
MAPPPAPLITDDATPGPLLKSSLLIIGGLLLFAAAAVVLFRYLLRRWGSSSFEADVGEGGAARRSAAAAGRELVEAAAETGAARRIVEVVGRVGAIPARVRVDAAVEVERREVGDDIELLIASLPLFTMASALAAVPKNSPDCAVCLSPFDADAELRLLPACRHAFHAACVDEWLRTNPVCPICRNPVSFPLPPLPSAPAVPTAAVGQEPLGWRASWRSFRVELGSVSNRCSSCADDRRTYSLGGSFDYRVDEEVEAIVSSIVRPAASRPPRLVCPTAPAAPGEALAEAVGSRGWLGEYLDRVSGRWSGRLSLGRRSHSRRHGDSWRWDPEAAAAKSAMAAGEAAVGICGGLEEHRDRDNLASSAPSFSGRWSRRWSLGHRRDESWRWDPEARRGRSF